MFVNGIIILKKGGGGKGSFGVRGIVYTLPPPLFLFFLFFFGSFFFLFFLSRVAAARSSKIGGYKERSAGIEPRRDRGFRAGGTDGRARWGRAVSEGLILHAVPYGSLIIAVFIPPKQKNRRKICVCAIFVVILYPK